MRRHLPRHRFTYRVRTRATARPRGGSRGSHAKIARRFRTPKDEATMRSRLSPATRCATAACIAALSVAATHGAYAADAARDYPNRPVRIIIPFPPGGSNDIVGRFMAARLTDRLGQQHVADNRPGADGLIGSELAVRSQPDGYTLLIISTSYTMNPAVHKMPFDPQKALAPVAMIGTCPNTIATFPGFPASTIRDLIAAAKAKPGQINYASSGIGGFNHFGGELFKSMTGTSMTHVPYKGGGPAMIDVMAGQVPVLFSTLIQVLPHVRSGKVKALGVGGPKRTAVLPDVPTVGESGVPGYDVAVWWGLLAPAGTPPAIVAKVNAEVKGILAEPETQKRLAAEAAEPIVLTPAEFGKRITEDLAKWAKVAKQADIRAH